ncbi:MAG: EAL domain-containing protein [Nevskia sp.]
MQQSQDAFHVKGPPRPEKDMDRIRLLVMDDDRMVAEVATTMVEVMGGQGQVVTQVDDLLRAIDDWTPSHVAIDLIMPGVDGVEVLQILAQRQCKARILICSGMGGSVLDAAMRVAAANGLDVAGVLPKPFSVRELKALLAAPASPPAAAKPASRSAAPSPLTMDLRGALQRGEIFPMFMPKVDTGTGELVGFVANACWRHPEAGLLPASRFLANVERENLAHLLMDSIAEQSFRWLASSYPDGWLGLTVKLSAACLGNPQLVTTLRQRCKTVALDPRRVTLQLTEAAAMNDTIRAIEQLTRLRMAGFELSLGNFGIGYSSLMHLVRLPISELKLDPSLASASGESRETRAVAQCVVNVGLSLGLRVTASAIDTPEQLSYFNDLGCHYVLGYFIAQPMEGSAIPGWLAGWRATAARDWQTLLLPAEARAGAAVHFAH